MKTFISGFALAAVLVTGLQVSAYERVNGRRTMATSNAIVIGGVVHSVSPTDTSVEGKAMYAKWLETQLDDLKAQLASIIPSTTCAQDEATIRATGLQAQIVALGAKIHAFLKN